MRGLVRLRDICMACEKEVCTKGHEMEVSEGHMHGYFSEEELKSRFGTGKWRAIRCFAVWQKVQCRACDNCAESRHNEAL